MKTWHALVLVVTIVVAVAMNLIALLGKADLDQDAQLRPAIDSLSARIDKLDTAVRELSAGLQGRNASARPATGETVSGGEAASAEEAAAGSAPAGDGVEYLPVDIVLEIDAAGRYTLDGQFVKREDLGAEFKRVLLANPAMQLVVQTHTETPEAQVPAVLETAHQAGIMRISLASDGP